MADARKRKTGGESRAKRASQVEIITDAKSSRLQGWHHRRRLYAVLQLLRIPILALAALVMLLTHNAALAVCVAAVSLPLPWIAVLLANESGQVDETTNKVYKPALVREQRRAQRAALAGETSRPMLESNSSHPEIIEYNPDQSSS
ncbi:MULTISPECIES: DUF3099 domain-containing protein [unclassified Corynebacterium]|uniref:DUF3099 domain-containing protein n=1 Tax=unclassified Corynebacterium TaxID=2624378 RepID=UPI001EF2651F|nr:DUF3099 domain-containing protein [Corynebacterium sp. ACRPH]MCG7456216.1 DUF3099 domain-containing protein [Corynebacterium sp. ACRPH]